MTVRPSMLVAIIGMALVAIAVFVGITKAFMQGFRESDSVSLVRKAQFAVLTAIVLHLLLGLLGY